MKTCKDKITYMPFDILPVGQHVLHAIGVIDAAVELIRRASIRDADNQRSLPKRLHCWSIRHGAGIRCGRSTVGVWIRHGGRGCSAVGAWRIW